MRQQTETALAEADLVLFLIDAREGVTPSDKVFAQLVRASGRPVIVVANKCEGRVGEAGFYAAFELGFGEPVAISAEHGEGLVDLVADMLAALGLKPVVRKRGEPADESEPDARLEAGSARPIRVAIVGRPNAGKSTLVNAFLGEERMITGPEPGLTRDAVASDLEWSGRKVRLFDTAGLRRKARVTDAAELLGASDSIRAIRFAEVVVVLIDAERSIEHQDLTIADLVTQEGRALVLAINKWDLVEDKQKTLKELREGLTDRLSQVPGVALVPISALGRTQARQALVCDPCRLRHLEPPRVDLRPQPLARGGALAARAPGRARASHQDPLHDATLGAPADVRRLLLAARRIAEVLHSLPDQQPARGLRPAGRSAPSQPAQGRQSLRQAQVRRMQFLSRRGRADTDAPRALS